MKKSEENLDKAHTGRQATSDTYDIKKSVEEYNKWYVNETPAIYEVTKKPFMNDSTITEVSKGIVMGGLKIEIIKRNPRIIQLLRFSCDPILSPDRLAGLADLKRGTLVKSLEEGKLPRVSKAYDENDFSDDLMRILLVIKGFQNDLPSEMSKEEKIKLKSAIITDRLTNAQVSSKIRNAQEPRQMKVIKYVLGSLGYKNIPNEDTNIKALYAGQYSLRMNVAARKANQPVDVVIHLKGLEDFQISNYVFIECKSAGDFANVNKRRKEEAEKVLDLQESYPDDKIDFCLFIGGYFNQKYLDFERQSGIKIFWEHLPETLKEYIEEREG